MVPRTGHSEYKAPTLARLRPTRELVELFEFKLRDAGHLPDIHGDLPDLGVSFENRRYRSTANGR